MALVVHRTGKPDTGHAYKRVSVSVQRLPRIPIPDMSGRCPRPVRLSGWKAYRYACQMAGFTMEAHHQYKAAERFEVWWPWLRPQFAGCPGLREQSSNQRPWFDRGPTAWSRSSALGAPAIPALPAGFGLAVSSAPVRFRFRESLKKTHAAAVWAQACALPTREPRRGLRRCGGDPGAWRSFERPVTRESDTRQTIASAGAGRTAGVSTK